jgi:spore germination protein
MGKVLASVLIILLFATGCWDRVEVEERGFVVGLAIDLAEQDSEDGGKGKQRFVVTFQIVNPSGMSGGSSGGKGSGGAGGSEQKAYFNISSEGDSMKQITRELFARTSRTPYFEHLKIIVVSEEIARSELGFGQVLDMFIRDHEMRRGIKVMITKGQARDILDVHPPNERMPSMYINFASGNFDKNTSMLPILTIGDLHERFLKIESFSVPSVNYGKEDVKLTGAAVIGGDNRLIGFLGEEETSGLNFMKGSVKEGILKIMFDGELMIFDITEAKHKVKAEVGDKQAIHFEISIEVEGEIGEAFGQLDFKNPEILSKLEKHVSEEIVRLCEAAIDKVQKQYKVDTFELGAYLKQNHNKVWKQIKDDWDSGVNYFAKSEIRVKADTHIRRTGTVIKSEQRKEE